MSKKFKLLVIAAAQVCILSAAAALPQAKNAAIKKDAFSGSYVTESYFKRDKGYDWVSVSISKVNEYKYRVSVRSRGDRKRATCTFDSYAYPSNNRSLKAYQNEKSILLSVTGNKLTIKPEKEEDSNILTICCSGGASLSDTYLRISTPVDPKQIDKTIYQKFLTWDKFTFSIHQEGDSLTITPSGLLIDNNPITFKIKGKASDAEIGDLNSDGYPEVLIYTFDKENYGNIVGLSVNNGKSLSLIAFPEFNARKDLKSGYRGHDEFAIVETTFVQRFPIYRSASGKLKTGKTRQIQYKLKDGEAGRNFIVDKVIEF